MSTCIKLSLVRWHQQTSTKPGFQGFLIPLSLLFSLSTLCKQNTFIKKSFLNFFFYFLFCNPHSLPFKVSAEASGQLQLWSTTAKFFCYNCFLIILACNVLLTVKAARSQKKCAKIDLLFKLFFYLDRCTTITKAHT